MKLSELTEQLAADVQDTLSAALKDGQTVTVEPLLTNKAMAAHGRELQPGNLALRVVVVVSPDLPGDLGRMEIFVPVSKKQLKRDRDAVFGAAMRLVQAATEYRAEMIGRVMERAS